MARLDITSYLRPRNVLIGTRPSATERKAPWWMDWQALRVSTQISTAVSTPITCLLKCYQRPLLASILSSKNHNVMIHIVERNSKPRLSGITQVLDRGIDLQRLTGILQDHAPLIDIIKFGWGTALVTSCIAAKIETCRSHAIKPVLGGTLFEYCFLTNQYTSFLRLLDDLKLESVEISNGANAIDQATICKLVHELARDRSVFLEVGHKSLAQSEDIQPETWIRQIEDGLEANASMIILESRETGRGGYCAPDGKLRSDLCQVIVERFGTERLMFEAATSGLQSYLINSYGNKLNFANIGFDDIIPLETLRLGIRFDTMLTHGVPSQARSNEH
jgi:phosphosulfolactate synthase